MSPIGKGATLVALKVQSRCSDANQRRALATRL